MTPLKKRTDREEERAGGRMDGWTNERKDAVKGSAQSRGAGGGALGYFLGGYVPPGTPNWHPVLKKHSPKIDTPF